MVEVDYVGLDCVLRKSLELVRTVDRFFELWGFDVASMHEFERQLESSIEGVREAAEAAGNDAERPLIS